MNPNVPIEFCDELSRLFESGIATGRSGKRFDHLGAMSTRNNVMILRNLVMSMKPARTLEIGLAFGGSALAIASAHRDLGRRAERQHIALDPYQLSVWDECALVSLEAAGLREFVDFQPTFSWLGLPRIVEKGGGIGFIYVDGSHLFEDAFVDWFLSSRALVPNGVIAFDDASYPHVKHMLRFITTNLRGHFAEVDLQEFRPDKRKVVKYTLAKLLGKTQLRAFRLVGHPERKWDAALRRF